MAHSMMATRCRRGIALALWWLPRASRQLAALRRVLQVIAGWVCGGILLPCRNAARDFLFVRGDAEMDPVIFGPEEPFSIISA